MTMKNRENRRHSRMMKGMEIPNTFDSGRIPPDRDAVTRTYDLNGTPFLPPRRTRRIMERGAQRDEAWLQRRPHEPGYLRPEVDGEIPGECATPDAFVHVERCGPDDMRKRRSTQLAPVEWRQPGGL